MKSDLYFLKGKSEFDSEDTLSLALEKTFHLHLIFLNNSTLSRSCGQEHSCICSAWSVRYQMRDDDCKLVCIVMMKRSSLL